MVSMKLSMWLGHEDCKSTPGLGLCRRCVIHRFVYSWSFHASRPDQVVEDGYEFFAQRGLDARQQSVIIRTS